MGEGGGTETSGEGNQQSRCKGKEKRQHVMENKRGNAIAKNGRPSSKKKKRWPKGEKKMLPGIS